VFLEERDDMLVIELDCFEIEEERRLAVQPKCGGGQEGAERDNPP
jgi:hypothetical protein